MTDWPLIMVPPDDDRPAEDYEVERCGNCYAQVLEGELKLHGGVRCCERCQDLCPTCLEAEALEEGGGCSNCVLRGVTA